MNARELPWRTILWIERFLPTPAPLPSDANRVSFVRRLAGLIPVLVVVPVLARERHQFGEVMIQNRVVLAQLMLVVAGCVALAAIGFGVKAWRDAKGVR